MEETPSIIELAVCVQRIRYSLLAAHTLLIWDFFSLLEEEIILIHKSPWTSVKIIYLICRYYPLFIWPMKMWSLMWDKDLSVCERATYLEIFLIPLQVLPRSMFMIRAWAFSGQDPYILCLLFTGLTLDIGTQICGYILHVLDGAGHYLFSVLGQTGCFHQHTGVHHRL
ncbi:hypothetical protein BDZ94DRAFT_149635 [Collybia nuda]|uniref:DUF6533 domain-containing protein n=1 Tax=Collybia nuda TaxID=64659 RepID=A0A9P5XWX5_9AGAR|nr:hypothetical protein BDZ94DRAFT_149635 [Collybia nuda]